MRLMALASAGFLVLLSGSAWAADLAVGPPMTEPGFDWTGYYAGLQAGYGWGRSDVSGATNPGAAFDVDGGFVGGHVAGLWQFNQAVVGARAELDYASIDGSAALAPGSVSTGVRWLGAIDGEAGVALDHWLVYGVAGVAFAGTETSLEGATPFARAKTDAGWTLGAGIDYALTDNVIVGAQYRYYDFGKEHLDAPDGLSDQDLKLHTLGVNFSYKF